MTFAESFVLASRVRSKLTKEASNPKTSLRSLVLQANMLDNLMDHIAVESEKRRFATKVSFSVPEKPMERGRGPSVTEYEVDSDSDSDFSDSEDESEHDFILHDSEVSDEDDYYYSSDGEEMPLSTALASVQSYKNLPVIDLSSSHHLLVIFEEESEQMDMPELTRSTSMSDSDLDEEDEMTPRYFSNKIADDLPRGKEHHHLRHNAIYLMEHVF